jgi:predicted amidohydrolase
MATSRPAAVLGEGERIGSLRPGYQADVSVLALEEGEHPLRDMAGETRVGRVRIVPRHTIKAGRVHAPGDAAAVFEGEFALAD